MTSINLWKFSGWHPQRKWIKFSDTQILFYVQFPIQVIILLSIMQLLILFLSSYQTYSTHTFCKALLSYLYPFSAHLLLFRSGSFVVRQEMISNINLKREMLECLFWECLFYVSLSLSVSLYCHHLCNVIFSCLSF